MCLEHRTFLSGFQIASAIWWLLRTMRDIRLAPRSTPFRRLDLDAKQLAQQPHDARRARLVWLPLLFDCRQHLVGRLECDLTFHCVAPLTSRHCTLM